MADPCQPIRDNIASLEARIAYWTDLIERASKNPNHSLDYQQWLKKVFQQRGADQTALTLARDKLKTCETANVCWVQRESVDTLCSQIAEWASQLSGTTDPAVIAQLVEDIRIAADGLEIASRDLQACLQAP